MCICRIRNDNGFIIDAKDSFVSNSPDIEIVANTGPSLGCNYTYACVNLCVFMPVQVSLSHEIQI